MKKIYGIIFSMGMLFTACKKQQTLNQSLHPDYIKQLQDSMSTDFETLDLNQLEITSGTSGQIRWVRIPFLNSYRGDRFVLLRLVCEEMASGRIIKFSTDTTYLSGKFEQRSLQGKLLLSSDIVRGYVKAWHPNLYPIESIRTESLPSDNYLPEVVVIGYRRSGSAHPVIMPYMALEPMLDDMGDYSGGSTGGGGGSSGSVGPVPVDESGGGGIYYAPIYPSTDYGFNQVVEIEMDYTDFIPIIDIRKYFNCFDQVPSAGASYAIKLCADLPINSDPSASLTMANGVSPGHSFLVVSKTNGSQTVTQSFGYYPLINPSLWNPNDAVPSAIKNNGGQEINASYEINMTAAQFENVKETAIALSHQHYVLGSFNCADYALSVFNTALSTPISIPVYITQPGIFQAMGSPITFIMKSTPQTLFDKLRTMKQDNMAGAENIIIDLSRNIKAPVSHGECE